MFGSVSSARLFDQRRNFFIDLSVTGVRLGRRWLSRGVSFFDESAGRGSFALAATLDRYFRDAHYARDTYPLQLPLLSRWRAQTVVGDPVGHHQQDLQHVRESQRHVYSQQFRSLYVVRHFSRRLQLQFHFAKHYRRREQP
jgi:hypothetical protein